MFTLKNGLNNLKQFAIAITNAPKGTGYLGFRDLPEILSQHVKGRRTLDVGCGSGRSTRFLKALGYNVTGIDTSLDMINQALDKEPDADYRHIESPKHIWPIGNEKFDKEDIKVHMT